MSDSEESSPTINIIKEESEFHLAEEQLNSSAFDIPILSRESINLVIENNSVHLHSQQIHHVEEEEENNTMSDSGIKIQPLDSTNYESWKIQMRAVQC
ncbi:CLUMA_CG013146, isoform A [Clunio marinus]|uniref:CLUMA_CG013146, isoform A n=1 Tax=Clunio marinus TaxID=568069 RepID=A0A1J1II05_9DIPT|nr:CLUMA_CG013146, isoform A [Clunio marinus]